MVNLVGAFACNVTGMDALIPELENNIANFKMIGADSHIFDFIQGGVRIPAFKKSNDFNQAIKTYLHDNGLQSDFTGKIIFGFYNGRFVGCHCVLPQGKNLQGQRNGLRNVFLQHMLFNGYIPPS